MLLTKLKATAAVILLAVGIMGLGVGLLPRPTTATAAPPAPASTPAPKVPAPVAEHPLGDVNIPARRDGQILVLGTEIKEGEKVPAQDVVKVTVDGKERRFRRLNDVSVPLPAHSPILARANTGT